ncbi:MAG: acetate kinase [Clostridia bacterium]|nr:acetate kinase [Clostridia bacterium]
MKILVVNAGSSSLKYQLIDMDNEQVIAKGLCDKIGLADSNIKHKAGDGREYAAEIAMPTHSEAFEALMYALAESDAKVISSPDEIGAIGHRVVHGGTYFNKSCLVDDDVAEKVDELKELAPLHNHPHYLGIVACTKTFGKDVPQVVVFDTAFHQTMPEKAYIFGLPYEYYEKYAVRRYGAHGTSHKYVSERCADLMGKDKKDLKIVTCHIGNGASITAVDGGICVDTSMGFTPLDGFIMGTRSGGVDPSALTYIANKENITPDQMSDLLNKKSGLLGISGVSSDNRDVSAAAAEGNHRAALANEIQRYQIAKFVGSYIAAMNGVDAIVFTAGIGENDPTLRTEVCKHFGYMGVKIDEEKNLIRGEEVEISTPDSTVKVFIIPTNEELAIAKDTLEIVTNLKK